MLFKNPKLPQGLKLSRGLFVFHGGGKADVFESRADFEFEFKFANLVFTFSLVVGLFVSKTLFGSQAITVGWL